MARNAMDADGKVISIEEWELHHKEETPFCMVCEKRMYIKGGSSPGVTTHFAHFEGSNCPSIEYNREKYDDLKPSELDLENGKKIQGFLLSNIWAVYQKCKEIFGKGLTKRDYQDMIRKASEKKIWYYKGMKEEYIPYVLLVNYGIFKKNDFHKEKTYFVFDANLSSYEDLWIKGGKLKQKIWRVKPDIGEIKDIKISFDISGLADHYFLTWATGLDPKNIYNW